MIGLLGIHVLESPAPYLRTSLARRRNRVIVREPDLVPNFPMIILSHSIYIQMTSGIRRVVYSINRFLQKPLPTIIYRIKQQPRLHNSIHLSMRRPMGVIITPAPLLQRAQQLLCRAFVIVDGLIRSRNWRQPITVPRIQLIHRFLQQLLLLRGNSPVVFGLRAGYILRNICKPARLRRLMLLRCITVNFPKCHNMPATSCLHFVGGVQGIRYPVRLELDSLRPINVFDINFVVPDIRHHVLFKCLW